MFFDILKSKKNIVILIMILLLSSMFMYYSYQRKLIKEKNYLDNYLQRLENEVNIIIDSYQVTADLIFNNIINKEEIAKLIYEAHYSFNDKTINKNRDILKTKMQNIYQDIKYHNFRQLHFHLEDGTSFLRMHRPDTHGDNLWDVRDSVRYVNTNNTSYSGFEEGRIFNGYRYVYPIEYRGNYPGSVELSISYAAVTEKLTKHFGGYNTFIISKKVVEDKVFTSEKSNYMKSDLSKLYLYDKAVYESINNNIQTISKDVIIKINNSIKDKIHDKLKSGKSFSVKEILNDCYYIISFLNVENISGEKIAYLISYDKCDTLSTINAYFKKDIFLEFMFIVLMVVLVLFIVQSGKKFKDMAVKDRLTGIANRYKLDEIINREYHRKKRYNTELSIIMFDIDHFKKVNDNYGHSTGDQVLKEISEVVHKNIRDTDILGRWGGEEFLIVLPETNLAGAKEMAEKLRKIIEEHTFTIKESITASFGVVELGVNEDVDEIIKRVDHIMYEAKNKGRNRVEIEKTKNP